MDKKSVRSILGLHRRGDSEMNDARFLEAERQAKVDPSLASWWADEEELDELIAMKLGSTPVPPGLKERLRFADASHAVMCGSWQRPILLAAACLVALAVLFSSWRGPFQPAMALADYRDEMVSFVKVTPALELEATDLSRITSFLQQSNAPFAFAIPKKLRELQPVGCRTLRFRGYDVALVCFRRENGKLAHLFVVDRAALRGLPNSDKQSYSADGEWMTAAWAEGDKAYLVTAQGDHAQLEKFVKSS